LYQEIIMSNQSPVILAVDDDPFNLDIIDEFISGEGFELLTAESGEKALAILRCGRPKVDVVLLDRMMPGLDGLEVLQQIKKDPELGMIPVILLTAACEQTQVTEGVSAGCFYYLTKPFDRTVLNKVLTAALREQTVQESAALSSEAPTPLPSARPAEPELPGLAVARGLEMWKKATVYQQYLRKFAHNYADCVLEMAQAERTVAASIAHKLKGSAGNLAIVDVAAIAAELDHALRTGESPTSYYFRLRAALGIAFGSIARYAAADLTVDSVPSLKYKRERLFPMLDRLIRAFNTHSPDEIKPAVTELVKVLPTYRLKPIYIAMENFDFRGGETATRSIAVELCL
jgi:CheY-like chemotaxis protein